MRIKSAAKYIGGGLTKPRGLTNGEKIIINPAIIINKEVKTRNLLGRLSKKGIFPVRMMWITKV